MKKKLAWVKWDDACFREKGWHGADEVDPGHTMHTESSGFLVREDAKGIVLAVDYDPEDNKWRGLTFIPAGMVRQKKVFTLV